MNNDQRNPSLVRGDGETLRSYGERLHEYISKLEWQSDGHIRWYTHKNPYGCWICETLQICRLLENELMDLERVVDGLDNPENDGTGPEPRELDDK